MPGTELSLLLRAVDQAYDARSWHGTNLRGSIRGLELEEVCFRPGRGRHNIWELVVHCAYWKYTVRRRFTGEKRGSFPAKGSNFFRRPEGAASEKRWREDVKLLDATHASLRDALDRIPARALDRVPRGTKYAHRDMLLGIVAHDLYHAGQIQLLKRLAR